jgi:hypothetical protein
VKPEALQSLSVGLIFIGLFFAAVGGFGAFHFRHRVEREQEQQHTVATQTLVEIVSTLREEQRELQHRMVSLEEKAAEVPPPVAAIPTASPAPAALAANPSPVAAPPPVLALATPPPPMPDLLLPHLPAIAQGPPPAAEPEPPAPAIKPPKLQLPVAAPSAAAHAAHEENAMLGGQKRSRLLKRLRDHPQQGIVIRAAAENAPAVKLAITLKSVFREAGWSVGDIEMVTHRLPAHTLLLSTGVFPPPKEFVAVYAALAGNGFLVTSDLDPNQGRQRVVVSVGPIH